MSDIPVVLISGIAKDPMALTTVALQWDLPGAVAVHHEIDPDRQLLIRTVSDATGVLEKVAIDIEHACISCAIRQDIVPTLQRLATTGTWQSIIAQLPVTAEAVQVCRVLGMHRDLAPDIRICASIVALDGSTVCTDLLGDDLVSERGLSTQEDDHRGIGEVSCAMVEYADIIAITDEPSAAGAELLQALARPNALIVDSISEIDTGTVLTGIHDHRDSDTWVSAVRRAAIVYPQLNSVGVLDFRSHLPFHPQRLRQTIPILGGGARRSRGCFWLPSRPRQVCIWDGAGGQLSIGSSQDWGQDSPCTRIVVVGLDRDMSGLQQAFHDCLLTPAELAQRGMFWEVGKDGFEQWLGPIYRAA